MATTRHPLLADIIDYAGLFPPAALDMDDAVGRYLRHRRSADGWLLARFVCPAARLGDLAAVLETVDPGRTPIRIAALGAGGDDPPAFADALENDIASMAAFENRLGDTARIDVLEIKLPTGTDPSTVVDLVLHEIGDGMGRQITTFFEVSLLGEWPARLATGAEAIAAAGSRLDPDRRAGLKIRCGGLDASAIPGVEAVSAAVTTSVESEIPLKATQGLHHPIRHLDAGLGATAHGFLNLAAATIQARAHALDEPTVREILSDEEPGSFAATEEGLRWRDLTASPEAVREGRSAGFAGFGSCSFTEPRDDLSDLGLI